jgi:hypothetical protein
MPKKKKKKRKSKAEKRVERNKRSLDLMLPDEHPTKSIADFESFFQDFIDSIGEDSEGKSQTEIQDEHGKHYGICVLAWDLSIEAGTYEKSIEELNLLAMNDKDLVARMGMKFMLVHALRVLFGLPSDEEHSYHAAVEILTQEELDCFYENVDLIGLNL